MLGGVILTALGLVFFFAVLQPHTAYIWLLLGMVVLFFGIDSAMPATTMSIMGSIPVDKAGVGSAMNDMTGQIGGALGVALFGSMLNRTYFNQTAQLQSQVSAAEFASIQNSIFSAHETILTLPADLQSKAMELVDQAFVSGMKETLVICTLVMLLIAFLIYRFLPNELRRSSLSEQNGKVDRKSAESRIGLD